MKGECVTIFLVFGSSSTEGYGDAAGGWADRIKRKFSETYFGHDEGQPVNVYNLGIGGDNAEKTLARIKQELPPRIWFPDAKIVVVIAVGANDARAQGQPDKYENTPETYRATLEQMIAEAERHNATVVFVGTTPNDNARTNPIFGSYYFDQNRTRQFDEIMSEVAVQHGYPKVELFDAMLAQEDWQQMLYKDGLHPNTVGHAWIVEQVWPVLQGLIEKS
jgi:lysophospholipase L1-like esterase